MSKKVSKGGQYTFCCDDRSRHIYLYMPRHSTFQRDAPFTQEGQVEIKRIIDNMMLFVKDEPNDESDTRSQIFDEKPCIGFDNHFSGDNI